MEPPGQGKELGALVQPGTLEQCLAVTTVAPQICPESQDQVHFYAWKNLKGQERQG